MNDPETLFTRISEQHHLDASLDTMHLMTLNGEGIIHSYRRICSFPMCWLVMNISLKFNTMPISLSSYINTLRVSSGNVFSTSLSFLVHPILKNIHRAHLTSFLFSCAHSDDNRSHPSNPEPLGQTSTPHLYISCAI